MLLERRKVSTMMLFIPEKGQDPTSWRSEDQSGIACPLLESLARTFFAGYWFS